MPRFPHLNVAWSLPSAIVVLVGVYIWSRKNRVVAAPKRPDVIAQVKEQVKTVGLDIDRKEVDQSPNKTFSRSLSGVDSAPIDIIIPQNLRGSKSNPIVISDEDLDQEIEKIKSMKHRGSADFRQSEIHCASEENIAKEEIHPVDLPAQETIMTEIRQEESKATPSLESTPAKPSVIEQFHAEPQTVCQIESVTPDLQYMTPESQSVVPESQSVTPESQSVTPESQSVTPESQSVTPVLNPDSVIEDSHIDDVTEELQNLAVTPSADSLDSSTDVREAISAVSSQSVPRRSGPHRDSMNSNDSGKGHSPTSPTLTAATMASSDFERQYMSNVTTYEFVIPQNLVGRLIGKRGVVIAGIRDKTGVNIYIRNNPRDKKTKVCSIQGSEEEIELALKMIKDKFPKRKYSELCLDHVSFQLEHPYPTLDPERLHLKLFEMVVNETCVISVAAANHLFVQLPYHHTFEPFVTFEKDFNVVYDATDPPLLPKDFPVNTICVAHYRKRWYRAMVISTDAESETSIVKFVDFGGFAQVQHSDLRQVKAGLMGIPFQAVECLLANIKPANNETEWSSEAFSAVTSLTKGHTSTQIVAYSESGVPLVNMFCRKQGEHIYLNEELVKRGHAEWIQPLVAVSVQSEVTVS